MNTFNIIAFHERVQQAQTPQQYEQLKNELAQHVQSLSADERSALREQAKPVWADLHRRVDTLLAELGQPDPAVA